MDVRILIVLAVFGLLLGTCGVFAEEPAANATSNTSEQASVSESNQTSSISPDEALMNLALDARTYALENGKLAAISAFSDQASFIRNGMHISAYDMKGVLLADPYRSGEVGTSFIADDHDAGLVRQLRDLSESGGGIFRHQESGISYYALDVDGSWWLVAVSGR